EARREIEQRGVLEERRAGGHAQRTGFEIIEAQEPRNAVLRVVRHGDELVSEPVVQREPIRDVEVVVREEREVALTHVPLSVGAGKISGEGVDPAERQELRQVPECKTAPESRGRVTIEHVSL